MVRKISDRSRPDFRMAWPHPFSFPYMIAESISRIGQILGLARYLIVANTYMAESDLEGFLGCFLGCGWGTASC